MAAARDKPILELRDGAAWQRWLNVNHALAAGVWLKIAKNGSPKATVTQAEAIEAAICFGWVDGQLARHDEHFFARRFTPRRPHSKSSAVDRDRALRLIGEGRMQPAGVAEIRAAKADGRLDDAYAPQSTATAPEDPRAAVHEHPDARELFDTLTGVERYKFLHWRHHTKDPRRRTEPIADYVDLLNRRKQLTRD